MQITLTNSEFSDLKNALLLYISTINGNFKIILENINDNSLDEMSIYNKRDINNLLNNINRQEINEIQKRIFSDEFNDTNLNIAGQLYNNFSIIETGNSEISINISEKEYRLILEVLENKKLVSENNIEDYLNNIFELNEESKIFASIITKILSNYKEYRNYSTIQKYDNLIKKLR